MANSTGTYNKMAKWFKWSSLFILLIPIANAILEITALVMYQQPDGPTVWADTIAKLEKAYVILVYILLALSVVWIILNIILFLTAGTVKEKASPTGIRIGLFFSFVLVLAPEILALIFYYIPETRPDEFAKQILLIVMPAIVAIGYVVGFCCAKKAVKNTL